MAIHARSRRPGERRTVPTICRTSSPMTAPGVWQAAGIGPACARLIQRLLRTGLRAPAGGPGCLHLKAGTAPGASRRPAGGPGARQPALPHRQDHPRRGTTGARHRPISTEPYAGGPLRPRAPPISCRRTPFDSLTRDALPASLHPRELHHESRHRTGPQLKQLRLSGILDSSRRATARPSTPSSPTPSSSPC